MKAEEGSVASAIVKRKGPISRESIWRHIWHKDAKNHLKEKLPHETKGEGEIHSAISSRMKRKIFMTLNSSKGSLKIKRRDVIFTNPKDESPEQVEGETSCHHITIMEES